MSNDGEPMMFPIGHLSFVIFCPPLSYGTLLQSPRSAIRHCCAGVARDLRSCGRERKNGDQSETNENVAGASWPGRNYGPASSATPPWAVSDPVALAPSSYHAPSAQTHFR